MSRGEMRSGSVVPEVQFGSLAKTALRISKLGSFSLMTLKSQLHHKSFSDFNHQHMDMNTFNVSATFNVFRLLAKPALCLPHATISTFNDLPIPISKAFTKYKNVDIRAVVLDKDNCFAYPKANDVHKPYEVS